MYVLILTAIVIGSGAGNYTMDAHPLRIQQEFTSFENCETARNHQVASLQLNNKMSVLSHGCYKK